MDLASVVAALASVGVRVSGSTPNNNIQEDSSRACPTGLAGPEPSGTDNDPGQHFQGGSATVVGGSRANGFSTLAHIIFAAESIQATWTEGAPLSDILDVSKDPPRVFAATFACNTTGTMKHDDGAIR